MKFHTENNFLTKGSTQPANSGAGDNFVAFAIAPSSEVDLVDVAGHRLSPETIVLAGPSVSAVREPYANPLEGIIAAADGVLFPGEKLVLQCYEPGDVLIPPGPRSPYITGGFVQNAPTTAATAALLCRIPFSSRKQLSLWIAADAGADTNVVFRGVRYAVTGVQSVALFAEETAQDDAWSGAAAMPTTAIGSGLGMSRSWNIGGEGSEVSYDEIQVYAWNSVAANTIVFAAEAFGERGR